MTNRDQTGDQTGNQTGAANTSQPPLTERERELLRVFFDGWDKLTDAERRERIQRALAQVREQLSTKREGV